MQRRGFLASILAAGAAPAYVGSQILMPVRAIASPIWLPCGRVSISPPWHAASFPALTLEQQNVMALWFMTQELIQSDPPRAYSWPLAV